MVFNSYTYSVLIVSSSDKFNSSIKPLLPVSDYYPIDTVINEGAARRLILESQLHRSPYLMHLIG